MNSIASYSKRQDIMDVRRHHLAHNRARRRGLAYRLFREKDGIELNLWRQVAEFL